MSDRQVALSILIHDCDAASLDRQLTELFNTAKLADFEIILCERHADDDAWAIANRCIETYPGRVTLVRLPPQLADEDGILRLRQMVRGLYYTHLSDWQPLQVEALAQAVEQLKTGELLTHPYIGRTWDVSKNMAPFHPAAHQSPPLVSIGVYNYNYGRFLAQCLDSLAAQTYANIEICFSDNASTDASWQIALDFQRRHAWSGRRIILIRNRENFGPGTNNINCMRNLQGKYLMMLCSDDALHPDYVERCVGLLERFPQAAFAMVHRDIIDDDGRISEEPSFYDQTCLIRGDEQAAVYMMASVNPSLSQVFYRRDQWPDNASAGVTERWFGNRFVDFAITLKAPIVYIKEALLLHRVHAGSDGSAIDNNLIQGMGQYALALQFAEMAATHGVDKPVARLDAAIEKVGRLCLRYCTRFLLENKEDIALRYLHLAQAIFPGVVGDAGFPELQAYFSASTEERQRTLARLAADSANTVRRVSYAPPPGSLPC